MLRRLFVLLPLFAFTLTGCNFSRTVTTPLVPAALQVTTTPKSEVYLDGHLIGSTPLVRRDVKTGEHRLTIKAGIVSWASTITTKSATMTVVNRVFDENGNSSGEQFTLESGKGLVIIGQPPGASVTLDGKDAGVIPLALPDTKPGSYELKVASPGFAERIVKVKMSDGFAVIAMIDLAPTTGQLRKTPLPSTTLPPTTTPQVTPTPQASPTTATVSQTPNGFLRVRETPSTASKEVGRVSTGDSLTVQEEQGGWLKITTTSGLSGWVSGQYVQH